jgi:hypothetical protein
MCRLLISEVFQKVGFGILKFGESGLQVLVGLVQLVHSGGGLPEL